MNWFEVAEKAVYSVIENITKTQPVRSLHMNIKSVKEYYDKLPAVGIKALELTEDEDGKVVIAGYCEVVAQGEYQTANRLSEEIGSAVYDYLSNSTALETTGMREMFGEVDKKWICLVHVFWKVTL